MPSCIYSIEPNTTCTRFCMNNLLKQFFKPKTCLTLLACLITNSATAQINLGQFLSETNLITGGNAPYISIFANNSGPSLSKDIHIGVISPSGQIFEYPDWNQQLTPWLSNFTIPANFELENTKITDLSQVPGGLTPGIWQTFFALTDPGTLNITDIEFSQLNVVADNSNVNSSSGNRFGFVNISHAQNLNEITSVGASASFNQVENNLPEFINSFQSETPDIDQCVFTEISLDTASTVSTNTVSFDLDAGNLNVSSNGNSLNLTKETSNGSIHYFSTFNETIFENARNFTVTGSGGPDVGSFQITLPSLSIFRLLSPSTNSNLLLNPDQDFSISWESNNSGQEVFAQLASTNLDFTNPQNSQTAFIYCRFVDDGSGVIKRELIQQLEQFSANNTITPPVGLDIPELENLLNSLALTFVISRNDSVFFNTSAPDLDYAIATISSHIVIPGQFQ